VGGHDGRVSVAASSHPRLAGATHRLLDDLAAHHAPTAAHSCRVAALAGLVCDAIGAPPALRARLRAAALLHDVGKLAVPAALLSSVRRLSAHEWDLMRSHAHAGAHLVGADPALRDLAPAVGAVHERFGGGGYPANLAGEAIPWSARLLAVCDAYDAMRDPGRRWRAPMGHAEAAAHLRAGAPAQFDPDAVELVLRADARGRATDEHHAVRAGCLQVPSSA
jgi:putative nucleotidyltransferase with HDIG domain